MTMEVANVGLLSVLLLGLSVGFTTCTAVCMPFLGTWAFGQGRGGMSAALDTGAFALGKVAAYSLLGGMAGFLGDTLASFLKGGIGHYLIGAAAIGAGLWLLLRKGQHQSCGMKRHAQKMHPFAMGFALSFTPCAPLAALLTACAASADPWLGMAYGMMFGLGAAFTPLFIVIPLLGSFGQTLRQQTPWLGRWLIILGGLVLIAIGLRRIFLAM